jgi:lipoprotein-anchoring transpeptidase ErfK/SrfK
MLVPDTPEPFPIEAVDPSKIDRRFWRQMVPDPTGEPVGTVVVDPDTKFLWLVMENGRAMRYGIGVGREGFGWNGRADILRKARWPKWTPPAEMIEREPHLREWAGGMPGGPQNPLGARALYLYQDGVDTLYRIHGTSEPWSIGRAVSSGCIRLLNVEVIDLHRRVPIGTRVVVRGSTQAIS